MLDVSAMQARDFFRLFGKHPIISSPTPDPLQIPFRFVAPGREEEIDDVRESLRSLVDGSQHLDNGTTIDDGAVNPMTGKSLTELSDTRLPISMEYADSVFEGFDSDAYRAGVLDRLADTKIVYIQHRLSPYVNTGVEEETRLAALNRRLEKPYMPEDLPSGVLHMPWKFSSSDIGQCCITPEAYDQVRLFASGRYDETFS
jgi:hypothetical protein